MHRNQFQTRDDPRITEFQLKYVKNSTSVNMGQTKEVKPTGLYVKMKRKQPELVAHGTEWSFLAPLILRLFYLYAIYCWTNSYTCYFISLITVMTAFLAAQAAPHITTKQQWPSYTPLILLIQKRTLY